MSHLGRRKTALMTQPIWTVLSILLISLFVLIAVAPAAQTAGGQWYYIDSASGNDNDDGLSTNSAWKTLAPLYYREHLFQPGDTIALKRGSYWWEDGDPNTNWPAGVYMGASGTADAPITITTYGSGARPIIESDVTHSGAIEIPGDYVHVKDIAVTWAIMNGALINGSHNRLEYIQITGAETAIALRGDYNEIENCTIYELHNSSTATGVYVEGAHNTISDSSISGAQSRGILTIGNDTTLESLNITNVGIGIAADSDDNTIFNCTIYDLYNSSNATGIYVTGVRNTISSSAISGATSYGIVTEGDNTDLDDLDIFDVGIGIVAHSASNAITNCSIYNLHLIEGTRGSVGIFLSDQSYNNTVSDCEIFEAEQYGVLIEGDSSELYNLEISNVGIGVVVHGDYNTVDSCTIHDLHMIEGVPRGADGVYLTGTSNMVSHCAIYQAHEYGVLAEGNYNTLYDLEITDVGIGIVLSGDHNDASYCYIHDLHMIVNTNDGGIDDRGAVGVYFAGSHNEVSYCHISNCIDVSYDWGTDGGAFEWGGDTTIDGTYVHHNWAEYNQGFLEGGQVLIRDTSIAYNVSLNNQRFSTLLLDGPFEGQIEDFRVENNTIIEDDAETSEKKNLFWFTGQPASYQFYLRNNIIVGINSEYISEIDYNGWDIWHNYNLYYVIDPAPGFEPGFDLWNEEQIANPEFRDLGNRDFRLSETSPAIDAGEDRGYPYDFRHVAVPAGPRPDVGAYEFAQAGYQRSLPMGWSLVSLPLTPHEVEIELVLDSLGDSFDQVLAPDPATGGATQLVYVPSEPETNTLHEIDELTPFWIHMTQPDTLVVDGAEVGQSTQMLYAGWNMIAYPQLAAQSVEDTLASIDGKYSQVNGYDGANSMNPWLRYAVGAEPWVNTLQELEPGSAYHIQVDQDCTLIIGGN